MGKTFKDRPSGRTIKLPRVRIPMRTGTRVAEDTREQEEHERLYREAWWDYLEEAGDLDVEDCPPQETEKAHYARYNMRIKPVSRLRERDKKEDAA